MGSPLPENKRQSTNAGIRLKPRSRMASFSDFRCLTTFSLLFLYIQSSSGDPNCSFSFNYFGQNSNFGSKLALYGDAKVVNGGSSVQVSGSSVFSAGRLVYKMPIRLVYGNPRKMASFSAGFSFSMSPENGDGLAFVMVPTGFRLNLFDAGSFGFLGNGNFKVLGVEFDTSRDEKYGEVNGNHVGIDVDSLVSIKQRNVSSINLVLNSGEKLYSWIDYEAGSKRIEIRLSKLGDKRPVDPLISYPIDLSQMWKEEQEEVFVGLSSSSGNSTQKCNVYSWSFRLRRVPPWMHSQPLDPNALEEKTETEAVALNNKRSDCILRVLGALIFGTGCGALGAFIVLFVWTVFGNRRPVAPEEYPVRSGEFEYKKFKILVDKAIEK